MCAILPFAVIAVLFAKTCMQQSITLGRPPALDIRYTDCHFPDDTHPAVNEKGEKEWGCENPFSYLAFHIY